MFKTGSVWLITQETRAERSLICPMFSLPHWVRAPLKLLTASFAALTLSDKLSKLLEMVWGHHYVGELKIVDVNIRRLRIKIEDDPAEPSHIVTVRGYGYMWEG